MKPKSKANATATRGRFASRCVQMLLNCSQAASVAQNQYGAAGRHAHPWRDFTHKKKLPEKSVERGPGTIAGQVGMLLLVSLDLACNKVEQQPPSHFIARCHLLMRPNHSSKRTQNSSTTHQQKTIRNTYGPFHQHGHRFL